METIILLVLFILIPLANYVLERMRRRYAAPPDSRRAPDTGVRRQAPPPAPSAARRERAQQTPPAVVVRGRRSPIGKQHALFRNKRDVRRAIIAMTILGPCRAYDPPD